MSPAASSVPKNQANPRTPKALLLGAQAGEGIRRRRDRGVDIDSRMRRRQEPGFECRWREVHSLLEHTVKEAPEALEVAAHDFGKRVDAAFFGEEKSKHAAHMVGGKRDACARGCAGEALHQYIGHGIQAMMKSGSRDEFECREP